MTDNVYVEPSESGNRVSVATDEVDGVHHPQYKVEFGADGEVTAVDADNPLPVALDNTADDPLDVKLPDLTFETDTVILLNEISRKLSVLLKYEAIMHKVDLEEDM